MLEKNLGHRVFHGLVGGLIPAAAFAAVVLTGFSVATMLPYTARAHSGCTKCVHNVNHWTCGASNEDRVACNKVTAAYCENVEANCVGSTTGISTTSF
jgi:hypothetical protein